jgi:hypothetical protein
MYLRQHFADLDEQEADPQAYADAFTDWLHNRWTWFSNSRSAAGQGTVGCWNQIALDDRVVMDFIGRFESRDEDWEQVCAHIGIPHTPIISTGHGTKTKNRVGTAKTLHYSRFYNSETRRMIAELHAREIREFGYTFEEVDYHEEAPQVRRHTPASTPAQGPKGLAQTGREKRTHRRQVRRPKRSSGTGNS